MKKTISRITFTVEYDSTDEPNLPIVKHALQYLALLGDGIPSGMLHAIPGTTRFGGGGPTRVMWVPEHCVEVDGIEDFVDEIRVAAIPLNMEEIIEGDRVAAESRFE